MLDIDVDVDISCKCRCILGCRHRRRCRR